MDSIALIVSLIAAAFVFGVLSLLWQALAGARAEMRSMGRFDDRHGNGGDRAPVNRPHGSTTAPPPTNKYAGRSPAHRVERASTRHFMHRFNIPTIRRTK